MLTKNDEGLCHQLHTTFDHVVTSDLRWTERIVVVAFDIAGGINFIAGLARYPNRNLMDAYGMVTLDEKTAHVVRVSRELLPEPADTVVGPFTYDVIEPLKKVRVSLDENDLVAIGLYFAEGDKYVNLNKKYHHSGETAFVSNEKVCLCRIINLFEKLGVSKEDLRWRIGLNIKHDLNKENLLNYWISQLELNPSNNRPKWIYRTGGINTKLNFYSSKNGFLHITPNSSLE